MKIIGQNMPPRRGLKLLRAGFYKDAAPTALEICRAVKTSETVIRKIFDKLPVP